jgi:hypothetical protein
MESSLNLKSSAFDPIDNILSDMRNEWLRITRCHIGPANKYHSP